LEEAQRLARIGHWRADVASDVLTLSPVAREVVADGDAVTTLAHYLELVHPDDRDLVPDHLAKLPTDRPLDVVHRLRRTGARPWTVHLRASAELQDDGRIRALRGTVQDVTELHETERTLQRVLRATNDGWWDEDHLTGMAYYSHRWWELHGLTPPEGTVSRRTWRRFVPEDELVALDARFAEAVAAGQSKIRMRGQVRHAEGHLVPVVIRAAIEYDEHGRIVRVTGATRDVTQEVRTAHLQDVFISNVSHELRTPLTAISGALDLLGMGRAGSLSPEAGDLLEVAGRNTERLKTLIADLLDLEQLAIGAVNLHLEVQPLAPIVDAAVRDIEPYAEQRQVRFAVSDHVSEVRVQADAIRIGQVLANYLSNAAKYAPPGSTVQVRTAAGPAQVRIAVCDTGPGVPAAFRERAFERFAQADPNDPRSRGGTGLGLAISREIVLRHGGDVGYSSQPGDTVFWFELPVVE
ncbi:MAG: ATP-binding protein, partial [Nitriliruptoraceae bacterium]